jgi:hypothetical protein
MTNRQFFITASGVILFAALVAFRPFPHWEWLAGVQFALLVFFEYQYVRGKGL